MTNEIDRINTIKTMSCRAMQQALIFVAINHDIDQAIEEAIEGELTLTLCKAKKAGMRV